MRFRPWSHPLADRSVARPEVRRRYDELLGLVDAVLEANDLPAVLAAESAARTLGLPYRYRASIGHLDVCLDATKPKRWFRGWASIGKTYVCITDHYDHPVWRRSDGSRMRPIPHRYELR